MPKKTVSKKYPANKPKSKAKYKTDPQGYFVNIKGERKGLSSMSKGEQEQLVKSWGKSLKQSVKMEAKRRYAVEVKKRKLALKKKKKK